MSAPSEGRPAPDFELEGSDGTFRLSEQRGRKVVLLFYPGDDTAVCTKQFCSYRDSAQDLSALDAVVVGISRQDLASHEAFIAKHGLTVPLLADPEGRVAELYGVAARLVGTRRAVFVVDEQGVLLARKVHVVGLRYESATDLKEMVSAA